MGKRRKARELALKILYQIELSKDEPKKVLDDFFSSGHFDDEVKEFTKALVVGTVEKLKPIDRLIKRYAQHWDIERMTAIDRNILRFATFELLYLDTIPPKVTINEAIEIAKRYGTTESSRFVNGILDRVLHEKE